MEVIKFINRKVEVEQLSHLDNSNHAEWFVLYGRSTGLVSPQSFSRPITEYPAVFQRLQLIVG
jgi:hypothetical protein